MTTKEIDKALKDDRMVVLGDDRQSRLCYDLFGNLVVVSLRQDAEPIRMATPGDKRRAKCLKPET